MRASLLGGVIAAIALLGLATGFSTCGDLPEDAAASVNGVVITKEAAETRIDDLRKSYGPMIPQKDVDEDGEEDCEYVNFRRGTTEQLVQEELERQEAEKRDVSVSEAEIDDAIQTTADDGFLGDVDRLLQSYFDRGFSEEQLRSDVERTILHDKVMNDVIGEIEVTDEDVQAYYDRNIDQYQQPERRSARQLVTNDEASALAAVERARAGEDFIVLVRELSVDAEAQDNLGSLGLVVPGALAAELDAVVYSLEPQQVSDPVKIADQWYVIRLETVIPPVDIPLEQEKDNIKLFTGNEMGALKWKEFVDEVYENASIEYNPDYNPAETDEDCLQQ